MAWRWDSVEAVEAAACGSNPRHMDRFLPARSLDIVPIDAEGGIGTMRPGVGNAAAGDNQRLENDYKSKVGGRAEAAPMSTAEVVALPVAVDADRT